MKGITFKECPTCRGEGGVDDKFNLPYNRKFIAQNEDVEFGLPKKCPDCDGQGKISEIDFGDEVYGGEDFWDVDSSYGVKSKDELVNTRLLLDKNVGITSVRRC